MSEQPGYDPDEDPDADPAQLNPRTGGAAADDASDPAVATDPGVADQDADPESMNPRGGDEERPDDRL